MDYQVKRAQNGRRWLAFRATVLVYLFYVGEAVPHDEHGVWAVCGFAILIAFAACWLAIPLPGSLNSPKRFWVIYGLLVAPLAGAIPVAALLTFALQRALRDTQALADAQAELARLAAENERFRIARDLHDLLGHSLTTITVKAALAARLGEAEHTRATQEMTEVETLARQTLGDVRATVSSYRDVTLAGELASGRQLLRAAGITADLPSAVDNTDPVHQELFGWVVREGITNIVRHSRAASCAVRLSASSIEIVDDGVGGTAPAGNGLTGLRERVAAAGGIVD